METNIQKYQALLEAVRTGSFTRAANALSYSQSGVSRMIADLERDWGVTLVERGRAGVAPTGDGRALLPLVEALCDDYQRLQSTVDELRGLDRGSITIGTFSSVATHILPEVMGRFSRDYPNIACELLMGDYTEIETWLASGRVDLGFLPYAPKTAGLASHPIVKDELLAVLPEGHPLAARSRVPLAALLDEPFILLERAGDDEITPIFSRAGLTPQVRFSTWDDYAIMSMVESGLGISILPALILRRNPYRIQTRPLSGPVMRQIGVVYKPGSLSRAASEFLGYLTAAGSPSAA